MSYCYDYYLRSLQSTVLGSRDRSAIWRSEKETRWVGGSDIIVSSLYFVVNSATARPADIIFNWVWERFGCSVQDLSNKWTVVHIHTKAGSVIRCHTWCIFWGGELIKGYFSRDSIIDWTLWPQIELTHGWNLKAIACIFKPSSLFERCLNSICGHWLEV